jgi:hypothetical protein
MTALQAASAGVKDMADGSLRITIEFEPRYARDAFALFGARGTQVAIAALMDGSIHAQKPVAGIPTSEAEPPKEPIGDCCRRAVQWCKEPLFMLFLNQTYPAPDHVVATEKEAAEAVMALCSVNSRRELDTDNEGNKAWHRLIREPYRLWLQNQDRAMR